MKSFLNWNILSSRISIDRPIFNRRKLVKCLKPLNLCWTVEWTEWTHQRNKKCTVLKVNDIWKSSFKMKDLQIFQTVQFNLNCLSLFESKNFYHRVWFMTVNRPVFNILPSTFDLTWIQLLLNRVCPHKFMCLYSYLSQ